jgi:hypothetical protein
MVGVKVIPVVETFVLNVVAVMFAVLVIVGVQV